MFRRSVSFIGRRPLNRDRPWPGRPFPSPLFVGGLVGRLFWREIIQIYQLHAEDEFSLSRRNHAGARRQSAYLRGLRTCRAACPAPDFIRRVVARGKSGMSLHGRSLIVLHIFLDGKGANAQSALPQNRRFEGLCPCFYSYILLPIYLIPLCILLTIYSILFAELRRARARCARARAHPPRRRTSFRSHLGSRGIL